MLGQRKHWEERDQLGERKRESEERERTRGEGTKQPEEAARAATLLGPGTSLALPGNYY